MTGASSGIGRAFAHQLAARGMSLVLTARRMERLLALAAELRAAHGVEVTVLPFDLARSSEALSLYDATEGAGLPIDVLINNAGFGTKKNFVDTPWQTVADEMQLNMISLTELTHLFTKAMLARNHGYVLNVSSIGAYLPTPSMATYAAGKSYVRNFTEALAFELGDTNVRVCCLCPGPTESEFSNVAGIEVSGWKKSAFMSAEDCARIGLDALFNGRRNIVSGVLNTFSMFMLRFVPRRMAAFLASKFL
ncbi:MAG: SDR family oxidoreductase [Sandaracinaceae bacterium]|nr:SDR family oxidoreductase [Sandaracinaceae bacterium]